MHELKNVSRRTFLASSLAAGVWGGLPASQSSASLLRSANEQLRIGVIGVGWRPDIKRQGRGMALAKQAVSLCDVVMLCDVDQVALQHTNQTVCKGKAETTGDYHEMLARPDIDAVLIASPDHWHTKMAADAMRAGKAVYCEKPATHHVTEGTRLLEIEKETGKTLLVGTQQRTEYQQMFARVALMMRQGRLGELQSIEIGLDPGNTGGPFPVTEPPPELDYESWLGPAPKTPYIKERTHWTFRWWHEYAGGKMSDWGAHHVDIALWGMNLNPLNKMTVRGTGQFQTEYQDGLPLQSDLYNMPSTFEVHCELENGVSLVLNSGRNGITLNGSEGRVFVNRGKLEGEPVDRLKDDPISRNAIQELYGGDVPASHMHHFLDCVRTGRKPISDLQSHQQTMVVCHLANLSMRLKRPLQWDGHSQSIVNDDQATSLLSRKARPGYGLDD